MEAPDRLRWAAEMWILAGSGASDAARPDAKAVLRPVDQQGVDAGKSVVRELDAREPGGLRLAVTLRPAARSQSEALYKPDAGQSVA